MPEAKIRHSDNDSSTAVSVARTVAAVLEALRSRCRYNGACIVPAQVPFCSTAVVIKKQLYRPLILLKTATAVAVYAYVANLSSLLQYYSKRSKFAIVH